MNIPTLSTSTVLLRPLTMHDAHAVFMYAQQETVTRFTHWQRHSSIASTQHFIGSTATKSELVWAITLHENSELIGECGIILNNGIADIHCALNPTHWGKGFAHEALTALIDYSFTHLPVRIVQASIVAENTRSLRLAHKLNMIHTATLEKQWLVDDQLYDVHVYSLTENLIKKGGLEF